MFFFVVFFTVCLFSAVAVRAAAPECSITKDCNQSQYKHGVCLIMKLETVLVQLMPCLQRFQILMLFF